MHLRDTKGKMEGIRQQKSYSSERDYRKKWIEIGAESAKFNTTCQRLSDQEKKIFKKSWFSGREIPEICGQLNHEKLSPKIPLHEM